MAHPFGGHPTLGHYMAAAKNAGFSCTSGICGTDAWVKISSEETGRYVFTSMDQKEFLAPSQISHFDRRLGWKSPFQGKASYD